MNKVLGFTAAIALVGTVVAANWATSTFGFIPVGFGLTATAGTFAAGVALALRNLTQDLLGKAWMLGVIAVGAVVSYFISAPMVALASAAAFTLAELAEFFVYTPLRRRYRFGGKRWAVAVVSADTAGAILDTILFLGIAFGLGALTIPALAGQVVGKAWATLAYLLIGKAASGPLLRKPDKLAAGA